ncbi:MAG: roadblock/LC7 domain-containing protein [Candidatus Heimdallarchaeaceae archaeon]
MILLSFGLSTTAASHDIIECLNELRFRSLGITDIAVVSVEGLPIASLVLDNLNETRFSAMTAASISLGERVVSELNKGNIKKILIEGELGFIVTMQAGENAVITVSTTKDAKLGLLFLDLERSALKIARILS